MLSSIRKWIRSVFGFSRTETNGLIILLPLIGVVLISAPLYKWVISCQPPDIEADKAVLDKLVAAWEEFPEKQHTPESRLDKQEGIGGPLFSFNPNTASPEILQRLGFSVSLSNRIANYRKKGGQFRVKGDLRKIYGLDSAFFVRVYAYVELPVSQPSRGRFPDGGARERVQRKSGVELSPFDLNDADTLKLKSVNGIGDKLAARIIKYRNRLGGFINVDQLKEVYGLDSVVVRRLKDVSFVDENFTPNLLNINTLTEEQMSAHPYISRTMAKVIVAWRFQHGEFKHTDDLRKIRALRKEDIDRIIPYLQHIEP